MAQGKLIFDNNTGQYKEYDCLKNTLLSCAQHMMFRYKRENLEMMGSLVILDCCCNIWLDLRRNLH